MDERVLEYEIFDHPAMVISCDKRHYYTKKDTLESVIEYLSQEFKVEVEELSTEKTEAKIIVDNSSRGAMDELYIKIKQINFDEACSMMVDSVEDLEKYILNFEI